MSVKSYPHLAQFLGAYFHQDWSLESEDAADVVERYVRKAPTATLRAITREIHLLRAEKHTEEALHRHLTGWGCAYPFLPPHNTRADWLAWLENALNRSRNDAANN